jgi:hypothetical protein
MYKTLRFVAKGETPEARFETAKLKFLSFLKCKLATLLYVPSFRQYLTLILLTWRIR